MTPYRPLAQPVRTREARAAGITRATLREGGFRRVRHGTYLPADADQGSPDTRIAIAAASLSPRGTIGGWAAARLHELAQRPDDDVLTVFDGVEPWPWGGGQREPILVCLPRTSRLRDAPDVRHFRSDLDPAEVGEVNGIPVTSPLRTAFDLARLRDRVGAVVALDRLAHLDLIDLGELAALFRARSRWAGATQGAVATRLADAGAESPPESLTRLLCRGAGLDGLIANAVVRRPDGGFVARVDLLDVRAGLVVEYDGEFHASAGRRRRDAARQEQLEELGLVVVRVTGVDLATAENRRALQVRLRAARVRAAATVQERRRWVVDH